MATIVSSLSTAPPSSNEVQLVPKPNTTSPVWKYFALEIDEKGKVKNDEEVVCRLCSKEVIAKGSNTSNLISHLRVHHPSQYIDYQKMQKEKGEKVSKTGASKGNDVGQTTIVSTMEKLKKYDRSSKKWKQLTDSVTYLLAKDMLPLYSVEKEGFQRLVKTFDSQYQLPNRKYFTNTAIPALYASTQEKVSNSISGAKYFASTMDMWSSATSAPYMSYTVHYIDPQWSLQSWCLQTLFVPQDHNADNLADVMTETLTNWSLDPVNQVCVTTNNGSNIVCATSSRLGWNHLSCFGHNLHLAVTNSMKDEVRITRAFGVCRKLVELFAYSWKKKHELSEAKVQLKLPNHSLVSDCLTRWGSKEKMVARVLEQEKAIRQVVGTDRKTCHLVPTWQDIDVLQSVHSAVKNLADFTDMLSGEERVTLSALRAVLNILKNEVLVESPADTTLTKDIKRRILTYLEGKYSDIETSELMDVASFLDPRFITDYIGSSDLPTLL